MAQKRIAPHRKTVELKLDAELYEALMEAGKLAELETSNEILETAVLAFIADAAQHLNLIEQLRRSRDALADQSDHRQSS